jgi:DNA primase
LRAQPASRAEHAARILLAQSHLWAGLSNEDQAMLCEQPAPLAQLFVWLESQLHEHGPLNWTALRGELTDQEFADLALRLMGGATVPSEHSEEAALDLRDVLQRLCIDRLTAEMTVIAAQVADPEVRQRYRTLETRKKALIEELESVKLV